VDGKGGFKDQRGFEEQRKQEGKMLHTLSISRFRTGGRPCLYKKHKITAHLFYFLTIKL